MEDNKLYLCTKCFRRFLWAELSRQEHRCAACQLPPRDCAICDKKFEPIVASNNYCKQCEYYLAQQEAVKPQFTTADNDEDSAQDEKENVYEYSVLKDTFEGAIYY